METTMIKRNSEQNNKAKAYPPKKPSRPITPVFRSQKVPLVVEHQK